MALERNDQRMLLIGVAVLIVALAIAGLMGKPGVGGGGGVPVPPASVLDHGQQTFTGSGNSNTENTYNFTVNQTHVVNITFELSWTDEPNSGRRYTNMPDTLGLEVHSPDGTAKTGSGANPQGGKGSLSLKYQFNLTDKKDRAIGSWDIAVSLGTCGPQVPIVDIIGLREIADPGNAYTLTISFDYYTYSTKAAK